MKRIYLLPFFAAVCWSFSYVWTSVAFESFRPITLLLFRLSLASLLMLLIGLFSGSLQRIEKKHLPWFLCLALLEPLGYYLCETYGLTMVSPTFAAVILSTIPLFAPFVAFVVLREKISVSNVFGVVISMGGVLLLSLGGDFSSNSQFGVVLLFLAVFISIAYSIVVKRLSSSYSATTIVTYQNIFGALYFLPLYFFIDYPQAQLPITQKAILSVVLLAVFASAIAFVLFAKSLKYIGVSHTNLFLNLLPALTALFSFLVFGETFSVQKAIGIVVVVFGLFVGQGVLSSFGKR